MAPLSPARSGSLTPPPGCPCPSTSPARRILAWPEAASYLASDLERAFESTIPRARPSFDGLVIASDGGLWVRRFRDPGMDAEEWWSLDRNGLPIGLLTLPASIHLHAVHSTNRAAFVVSDHNGELSIIVTAIKYTR
jgi:hypothetical protein